MAETITERWGKQLGERARRLLVSSIQRLVDREEPAHCALKPFFLTGHVPYEVFHADRYFRRSRLIWKVALLSLPLDLLVLLLDPTHWSDLDTLPRFTVAWLALAVVLGDVNHSLAFLRWLRTFASRKQRSIGHAMALLFTIALLAFDFSFDREALIFLVSTVGGTWLTSVVLRRKGLEHEDRMRKNRHFWIEQFHLNLFLLRIAPIVSARAFSLTAALFLTQAEFGLPFVAGAAVLSGILLLSSKPQEGDFFSRCRQCAAETSRIFEDYRGCPQCETTKFRAGPTRAGTGDENILETPFSFSADSPKL